MMTTRTIPLLCAILSAVTTMTPAPSAIAAESTPVAAERSFPAVQPYRSLLRESVSTSNDKDWGGIETLDIPHTPSPVERQAQAASRNATRTPLAPSSVDAGALSGPHADVARIALAYEGAPYVYGGTTPAGWDCSGFTAYVYAQAGIRLPHQSEAQAAQGDVIPIGDAQPGDLMWRVAHVGIYLGDGLMIHASTPGTGTIITPITYGGPYQAIRIN